MQPLTTRQVITYAVLLAVLIEAVTVFFRFGLEMESTRDTASTVGQWTGGIRIHHGYIGLVAVLMAAAVLRRRPWMARWILVIGLALLASDLVHHFLVLWPIVGSPQFDLVYP